MKLKKTLGWLRRIAITVVLLFVVAAGILAVHIYKVTNIPKGGVDGWQMARVDLSEPMDSTQMNIFRNALHKQPGIYHSYVNPKAGSIAFAFDPAITHADSICNNVIKNTGIQAVRKKISVDESAAACPVINKNSITYRISTGFQKLFQ